MDIRKYSVGNYGGTPGASVLQQYMPDVVRQQGIQGLQAIPGLQAGGTTYNAPYYQSLPLPDDDKFNYDIANTRLNSGFPSSNTAGLDVNTIQQNTPVQQDIPVQQNTPVQWERDVDTSDLGYPVDYDEPKQTRTIAEVIFPEEKIFNARKSILSRWDPVTGFGLPTDPSKKPYLLNLTSKSGGGL